MKTHELKTWPVFFEAIIKGIKTFEVRENDRNFQVGDILILREYDPDAEDYTMRKCVKKVTYILSDNPFFQLNNTVIMGIADDIPVPESAKEEVKSADQKEAIKQITNAYVFLRANNQSIPDDILDLMKDSAIASITDASQFQSVQSKEEKPEVRKEISRMLNIAFNEGFNQTKSKEFDKWCKYAVNFIFGLISPPANPIQSVQSNENTATCDNDFKCKDNSYFPKCGDCVYLNEHPVQSVKGEGERTDEEIKTLASKFVSKYLKGRSDDPTKHLHKLFIEALESYKHSESKEQWISVKEKLPEREGFYLVVITEDVASKRRGSVEISDCYKSVDLNHMEEILKFQPYVTHWMPLPEPPKS